MHPVSTLALLPPKFPPKNDSASFKISCFGDLFTPSSPEVEETLLVNSFWGVGVLGVAATSY